MKQFKVGDVLRTDSEVIRRRCRSRRGNPDAMVVVRLDQNGDPIFQWESSSTDVGYSIADFQYAPTDLNLQAAMTGAALKFRSGCDVHFIAYAKDAKPHCQLILLNPSTGNIVLRYANGKGSTEPYAEPGDIVLA